jgi:hypothetical protein
MIFSQFPKKLPVGVKGQSVIIKQESKATSNSLNNIFLLVIRKKKNV